MIVQFGRDVAVRRVHVLLVRLTRRRADQVRLRTDKAQNNRKHDEHLEEAEDDNEEKNLKERRKDVRLGVSEKDECEKGADPAVLEYKHEV